MISFCMLLPYAVSEGVMPKRGRATLAGSGIVEQVLVTEERGAGQGGGICDPHFSAFSRKF